MSAEVANIRTRLREATAATHERLHHHPGFAAAAAGVIDFKDYCTLMARLYGFHHPFELAVLASPGSRLTSLDFRARSRSTLIAKDFAALGIDCSVVEAIPLCLDLPSLNSLGALFGALYVVEGSTLGGVHIARALAPILRANCTDGRRFWLGYGEKHGVMWRDFLAELSHAAFDATIAQEIVDTAIATFACFEAWMREWCSPDASLRRPNQPSLSQVRSEDV